MNKLKKLEGLAIDEIDRQEFTALVKSQIDELSKSFGKIKTWFNAHQHVTNATYTITSMKPFAEAQFKSFRVEIFTGVTGALGNITIVDTNGAKTDRIGKRKLRKAKKILMPAATMWFKSGFKDTMRLDEFLKLTLKR